MNLEPTLGCALLSELMAKRLLEFKANGCKFLNLNEIDYFRLIASKCFEYNKNCSKKLFYCMLILYLFNHNEQLSISIMDRTFNTDECEFFRYENGLLKEKSFENVFLTLFS